MKITKQVIENARENRSRAAEKFGCEMKEISWSMCVGMALRGEMVRMQEEKSTGWMHCRYCNMTTPYEKKNGICVCHICGRDTKTQKFQGTKQEEKEVVLNAYRMAHCAH